MRVLYLQGDHYQMGLQHGEQVTDLRAQIIAMMDARLKHLERRDDLSRNLQRVKVAWNRSARSTLAMLQGIADALAIPRARLFLYALASYLDDSSATRRATEGCTVWAASGNATRDGTPILTKNRDYSLAHLPLQLLAHASPQRGYRHLYVTSAGSAGVPCLRRTGTHPDGRADPRERVRRPRRAWGPAGPTRGSAVPR